MCRSRNPDTLLASSLSLPSGIRRPTFSTTAMETPCHEWGGEGCDETRDDRCDRLYDGAQAILREAFVGELKNASAAVQQGELIPRWRFLYRQGLRRAQHEPAVRREKSRVQRPTLYSDKWEEVEHRVWRLGYKHGSMIRRALARCRPRSPSNYRDKIRNGQTCSRRRAWGGRRPWPEMGEQSATPRAKSRRCERVDKSRPKM